MTPRDLSSGDSTGGTSRRALLRALTVAPVVIPTIASPWGEALAALHRDHDDEPVSIGRSKAGRSLSRSRYHTAESFFTSIEAGFPFHRKEMLYHAGIVAQLALSAHLLDVGFPDAWCARHIGLRVAKSLAYANATGLAHDCPDMARLATILTPYWKWNRPRWDEPEPDDGGFTVHQVRPLLRALLDRVHDVTGHPRPKGWRRHRREART
ncbi:hypothetical protein CLG96_00385 [Sphingomonas oleivorans]|uniref:Uncharacterized protein n=1 Tax=Sphingomonas oleivorans TaxID=1735121 RepID=A0A2T5G0K4_9SPHN|nr:hypothetical protein [Sphingomonas oleivorans]PTQ12663.1 hypothetical protein CLG96_00385 [Sphingomonas oleivorans]